ncbi:MAG: GDP-L-fucose synthase, partial [Verrucomicrobia bacterium]|nr:GDP-L-fucose synthase [Verrucomicrobiota bacterium]
KANSTEPYDFLYDNLAMAANVIDGSRRAGVRKLLFLGSSCIYPKMAPQPIREESLLTGPLEVTNEAYAVAKIAGIKLCDHARAQYGCDFISAMPCNLYGTGDNFSLEHSHVLPALIRKMHEAKLRGDTSLRLWGTGTPLREFLHADDLAEACVLLLERYSQAGHINVGSGEELSIRQLAEMIAQVVGFTGRLEFDPSMPDGTPRKMMDVSRIRALGPRRSAEVRATGAKVQTGLRPVQRCKRDANFGSQVSALRSLVRVIRYRCGCGKNSDPEPVPEPEHLNLAPDG